MAERCGGSKKRARREGWRALTVLIILPELLTMVTVCSMVGEPEGGVDEKVCSQLVIQDGLLVGEEEDDAGSLCRNL